MEWRQSNLKGYELQIRNSYTFLLEALGALHVERAVQVELVVELPDLVVLPRRLGPRKAAERRRVLDYSYLSRFVRRRAKSNKLRIIEPIPTDRSIDRASNRKHGSLPVTSEERSRFYHLRLRSFVRRHSFIRFRSSCPPTQSHLCDNGN